MLQSIQRESVFFCSSVMKRGGLPIEAICTVLMSGCYYLGQK
jgi:hypothetical protein